MFLIQACWSILRKVYAMKITKLNDVSPQITVPLDDWSKGDEYALEQLMPLVYDELHRMTRGFLRRQPTHHTLQTTELIQTLPQTIYRVMAKPSNPLLLTIPLSIETKAANASVKPNP